MVLGVDAHAEEPQKSKIQTETETIRKKTNIKDGEQE